VVVETTRKSMRNRGAAAIPTMEKAQQRAAERNLEKGNPFTVLDSLSDSHLSRVASDSCVVFTPSAGSPIEALSMIRAKERAQAALAEVAANREAAALAHAHAAGEAAHAEPEAEQPVETRGAAARSATAGEAETTSPCGEGPVPDGFDDQMQGASKSGTMQGKRAKRLTCPVLAVRKGRGKRTVAR
jgi:hypothetical protein